MLFELNILPSKSNINYLLYLLTYLILSHIYQAGVFLPLPKVL